MRGIIVAPWILAALATTACSREESGWEAARRDGTLAAYQSYLDDYPVGGHAVEARAELLQLRESEAWVRADRLGTPEAWQRYLGEWPDGRHSALARKRLVEFIPPAPPGFEIQLGAFSGGAMARAGLERLAREHPLELEGLSVRVDAPADGEPAFWRLRAGPFDEAMARAHCATLLAAQVSCLALPARSTAELR